MKVRGFDSLIRKLRKLPEQARNDIRADIADCASLIEQDAGDAAPVDEGTLRNSITKFPKSGGLNYIVRVGANYAPYIEFGTGTEINIPAELVDYAQQFKGAGKRKINLPARPFFFPAYFKHRDELIKNLKQTIKRHLR